MEPWQSWSIVAVAGAGAYWYYTKQKQDKRIAGRAAAVTGTELPTRVQTKGKNKKKKEKATSGSDLPKTDVTNAIPVSVTSSGNENVKERKAGKKKKPTSMAKSSAVEMPNGTVPIFNDQVADEEADNKEFARQLASAKAGTTLSKEGTAVRQSKTKKQSQINGSSNATSTVGAADVKDMSGNSSTTGADADDDLSFANSPALGATVQEGEGVSDMLETPTPGPSVLRLTEPLQPPRPSAVKQAKPVQVQETKKQRQNKSKREAQKAEREQAEKQRRILLEKQLKTAREAEGRPAKNGVPVPAPLKSNAWSESANGTAAGHPASVSEVAGNTSLLDTFDATSQTANGNQQSVGMKRDPPASGSDPKLSESNWPSEEEQMRMLEEMDGSGAWQTVNAKKRVNAKKDAGVKNDDVSKTGVVGNGDPVKAETTAKEDAIKTTTEGENKKGKGEDMQSAESGGTLENGGAKEEVKPKKKKGEYLPWKEGNHPDNSDWPVLS
ncbi:hypothetical protein MMC13_004362 [Lambiella insularis]|nr:hypothetical protein [Lambiella insularis]